jgi:hypothetical protein
MKRAITNPKVIFIFFLILASISPIIYLFRGFIGGIDFLISIGAIMLFLSTGYFILKLYISSSKNPVYIIFFLSFFIWPMISSTIYFYQSGSFGLAKSGLESRIGAIGDYVGILLLLDNCVSDGRFVSISLRLMILSNLFLIAPFALMYIHISKEVKGNSPILH